VGSISLRPIRPEDDAAVADIIRTVMTEMNAAGAGFAIHDDEVKAMAAQYGQPRSAYLVVVREDGAVVGGGGIAPLAGGDEGTCELKKMYFLPEARGRGVGAELLRTLEEKARAFGYRRIYLETLTGMDAAMKLYRKLGFREGCRSGNTGHFGCDKFFEKALYVGGQG
jgi:putative acetyltransferase